MPKNKHKRTGSFILELVNRNSFTSKNKTDKKNNLFKSEVKLV